MYILTHWFSSLVSFWYLKFLTFDKKKKIKKTQEPCNSSNITYNLGMWWQYFTVMLLISQHTSSMFHPSWELIAPKPHKDLFFHAHTPSPIIHLLAYEVPWSLQDCSYKQVDLELMRQVWNQFDVQSLRLKVSHNLFGKDIFNFLQKRNNIARQSTDEIINT
jgi:hypothetical protein